MKKNGAILNKSELTSTEITILNSEKSQMEVLVTPVKKTTRENNRFQSLKLGQLKISSKAAET